MELGVVFNEPHSVYHSLPCIGSHDLDDLRPYPLLFQKRHVTREVADNASTPAMQFGRYFHCLALEGEEAAEAGFVVEPKFDRRTKQGKADAEAFAIANGDKEIISGSDKELAWRMVEAIREKPSLRALFSPAHGKPEVTFRHKMERFTLQCRADWFIEKPEGGGPPMVIDVKTIDHLENFDAQFLKLGYYRHAAFYRLVASKVLGLPPGQEIQFQYVVVEKSEPFQVALRPPDSQSIDIGTGEVIADLTTLRRCFDSGEWPGEPDEPRMVSLPIWKLKQAEAAA